MSSSNNPCRRLVPARSPFPGPARIDPQFPWERVPQWPARWLTPPPALPTPWVGQFRLQLTVSEPTTHVFALTADERYELWVDGQRMDRGPDRGDRLHWHYATYELQLAPGPHTLMCLVWALGDGAPTAQVSARPGLLVAGEGEAAHAALSTGTAPWQWRLLSAWDLSRGNHVGPQEHLDAARLPLGWELGQGEDWQTPALGRYGNNGFELYPGSDVHLLAPSLLPGQAVDHVSGLRAVAADGGALQSRWSAPAGRDGRLAAWQALLAGEAPLTLAPGSRGRVLLDLGAYVCGRLQWRQRGGRGGRLDSLWSEAAFLGEAPPETYPAGDAVYGSKGDRAAWAGGWFRGFQDAWILDGATRAHGTLWWRAGRFIELEYAVGDEPLVLESLGVETTGYPFVAEAPATGDARTDRMLANCLRVLHTCAHETTMDCPHYEQLAYAGDARVQLICWLALCPQDTALLRHTLRHFQASALNPGLWTASSAPSRGCQVIPPFALWWVAMGADFLAHTGEIDFLRPMLPTMRAMVERWLDQRDAQVGLCASPAGWNFVDSAYPMGVTPGGMPGQFSGLVNWVVIHGLEALRQIELAAGETAFAERLAARGQALTAALVRHTWDESRGCFRDALEGCAFSEHAQALAWLTPWLPEAQRSALRAWFNGPAADAPDVLHCQAFMAYYLFKAAREAGAEALIQRRLEPWYTTVDLNFTTTPESFGITRSDAHAWGAHPLLLWLNGR